MSSFNESFDNTIRDPIDPEHSIEDPFHGSSALASLAEIPPMPLGNGLFYQPGKYYETGRTSYVDAENNPVFTLGNQNTSASRREVKLVNEWVRAYRDGSLEQLRAKREVEAQLKAKELKKIKVDIRKVLTTIPHFKLVITPDSPTTVPIPGSLRSLNDAVKVKEGLAIELPAIVDENLLDESGSSIEL